MTEIKPIVTHRKWGSVRHPHTISYRHPTPTLGWCTPAAPQAFCSSHSLWQKGVPMGHIGTLSSSSLRSVCEKHSTALGFPFRCLHLLSALQKESPHSLPAFLDETTLSPLTVTVPPLPWTCTWIGITDHKCWKFVHYPSEIIWTKNS